jgi:hypothetical protein
MSSVSFEPEELIEEARKTTGQGDFGPDDFRDGLATLAATYTSGAFNERGVKRNRRRLVQLLATRLEIQQAWNLHPEILTREIRKPMVLTGMPRSGTSALFNLLASDPAARPLLLWETQFPDPMPDFVPGLSPGASGAPGAPAPSDPRRDAVEAHYAKGRAENPEFTKIHYTAADNPEECVLIHAYAFTGVQMGVEIMLEPYASWYRAQDLGPLYAYYKNLLRLLDWQRPGERWLLKAPAHMWAIDPLIAHFPDVGIVWSHRDPLMCTASICSMTWTMLHPVSDTTTKETLGPVVMDFYATSLERGLAARELQDPKRFVDVTHDDFVDDSLGVAKRVYEGFGLEITPAARAALEAHVAANPKGKHGSHEYSLEEYGLDPARVRERFAPYIERFRISDR